MFGRKLKEKQKNNNEKTFSLTQEEMAELAFYARCQKEKQLEMLFYQNVAQEKQREVLERNNIQEGWAPDWSQTLSSGQVVVRKIPDAQPEVNGDTKLSEEVQEG